MGASQSGLLGSVAHLLPSQGAGATAPSSASTVTPGDAFDHALTDLLHQCAGLPVPTSNGKVLALGKQRYVLGTCCIGASRWHPHQANYGTHRAAGRPRPAQLMRLALTCPTSLAAPLLVGTDPVLAPDPAFVVCAHVRAEARFTLGCWQAVRAAGRRAGEHARDPARAPPRLALPGAPACGGLAGRRPDQAAGRACSVRAAADAGRDPRCADRVAARLDSRKLGRPPLAGRPAGTCFTSDILPARFCMDHRGHPSVCTVLEPHVLLFSNTDHG